MSRLSIELNVIPRSNKEHKFILCIIDEAMKYIITVSIHQSRSEETGDALIENVITKYGVPEYIIMDQDSAFMSSLMNYIFRKLDTKRNTVAPLQAEHGINPYQLFDQIDQFGLDVAEISTIGYIHL